jgi:hypothetical protein
MVSVFVKVDKVVIGLMFWNFIGMLLNVFLGYLELVAKKMQYELVFIIVILLSQYNLNCFNAYFTRAKH